MGAGWARPSSTIPCSRRGMSLVEIVFAMATLALAAMVVFTAIGFVHSRQKREQQMLACAEIANRLMLMRLDDETSLPDPSLSIAYDGGRYQWSMSDDRVRLLESPEVSAARALRNRPGSTSRHDRLRQLSIEVWPESTASGGARASLSRLYDPLAFDRNPNSAQNMFDNHLDQVVETILREDER